MPITLRKQLRTDLAVLQLPPTPLFSGLQGANTRAFDPVFGTTIVRVTDGDTLRRHSSVYTADAPDNCLWNTDDTMLVLRHAGGGKLLMRFNPNTLQVNLLPYTYGGELSFSSLNPNTMFNFNSTQIFGYYLGRSGWGASPHLICDFANILPKWFVPKWHGQFTHSNDDSTFLVAFSDRDQDTGYLVCVYKTGASGGYRMLNTITGEITGDWGETGTATGRTFGPTTLVHDASMSPNPDYALVAILDSGPGTSSIWNVPGLSVVHGIEPGHHAKGYAHYYAGGPGGGQYAEVPYANPVLTARRLIVPPAGLPINQNPKQHYAGDMHSGFGLVSPTDDSIFWVTSSVAMEEFTSAWINEVRGYQATGPDSGRVYRACHTYNSGRSKEFIVQNAFGLPSQTGRFVAFCSDMMGALGSTSGAAQSTLGVDARGDVFIVQVAD